jgi:hypothetical protein
MGLSETPDNKSVRLLSLTIAVLDWNSNNPTENI